MTRRQLRQKILQILYAHHMTEYPIEQVSKDQLEEIKEPVDKKFCKELISSVIEHDKEFDELINSKVKNWELERLALIDTIILKMGLAELIYFEDIPPKVTINEAVDLAKEFSTRNSGKFVNGILDAMFIVLKEEGKIDKKGKGLIEQSLKK